MTAAATPSAQNEPGELEDRSAAPAMRHRAISIRRLVILAGLAVLALGTMLGSMRIGATDLTTGDILHSLWCRVAPSAGCDAFAETVVWELRLPRTLMGAVAGAGLAIAGIGMQAVTRNPLVSPFTIGISSAAAFGASLLIATGTAPEDGGGIPIVAAAFAMSMLCLLAVLALASVRGASPVTIVLAGIAISYLFASLTAVLQFFASQEELQQMVHWTFGSLNAVRWREVLVSAVVLAVIVPPVLWVAWDLNAVLDGGDEVARTLGIRVGRLRRWVLVLTTFLASTIICFTGIIAFVGLVAPHIARYVIGADHRFAIPASAGIGAVLVVAADIAGRNVLEPVQLPIGIVISFVGVPLFLYLLLTRKAASWS